MRIHLLCLPCLLFCSTAFADELLERKADAVQTAISKAIPLLERGARGSMEKRPNCFTCHNQAFPMIALSTARDRGFSIDEQLMRDQVEFISKFLERNRTNFLEGRGTGGQVATAGTALWALEVGGYSANDTTAAVTEYLLKFDKSPDRWIMTSNRPPTEHSHFTANYLAIRSLTRFGSGSQKDRQETRLNAAREWLLENTPQETEDHVYRLWALKLLGVDPERIQAACDALLELQAGDGGWGQLPDSYSDAYATGTALAALHLGGGVATDTLAYHRGVEFLLRSQREDGSWYVASRSKPFQTYFESGFPHGNDQFISIAASSWAVTALSLSWPSPAGSGIASAETIEP